MALAQEEKVNEGTITSSPAPRPSSRQASSSAAVPEVVSSARGPPVLLELRRLVDVERLLDEADHHLGGAAIFLREPDQPVRRLVRHLEHAVDAHLGVDLLAVRIDGDVEDGYPRLDQRPRALLGQQHAVGGDVDRQPGAVVGIADHVGKVRMQQRLAVPGIAQEPAVALADGRDLVDQLRVEVDRQVLPALALELGDGDVGAVDAGEVAEHRAVDVDLRRKRRAQISPERTYAHLNLEMRMRPIDPPSGPLGRPGQPQGS
jgi:hypothetical protein